MSIIQLCKAKKGSLNLPLPTVFLYPGARHREVSIGSRHLPGIARKAHLTLYSVALEGDKKVRHARVMEAQLSILQLVYHAALSTAA